MKLIQDLGMQFATEKSTYKRRFGLYECPTCFNHFKAITQHVKTLHTTRCKKCSNSIRATKHNRYKDRLYKTWMGMIQRTSNINHTSYKHYGAKGITVCNEWLNIDNFIADMKPSFKEGLTLDRIDNNKGYSKENCRWSTKAVQARNRNKQITNTSGFIGVSKAILKDKIKYESRIRVNYKNIFFGLYDTAEEAAIAREVYIIDNNLEHTKNF